MLLAFSNRILKLQKLEIKAIFYESPAHAWQLARQKQISDAHYTSRVGGFNEHSRIS